VVFVPGDILETWEKESDDRIHKGIKWLTSRNYRIVAWFGRLLESARAYHGTLEDRLDPEERALRGMANARAFVIHHGADASAEEVESQLRGALRRQRIKHQIWFALDLAAIAAAIPISLFPGPNVLLYYPVLRVFSHYRALDGVSACLASNAVEFRPVPALDVLEKEMRLSQSDRSAVFAAVEALNLKGLRRFIERML
jgi:hypothetical protein